MRRTAVSRGDDGFTVAETLVALGIIGVVCASLAVLVVQSMSVDSHQTQTRTAIQVASAALERINQLSGDAVQTLPATEAATDAPGFTVAFDVHPCWQTDTAGPCTELAAGTQAGVQKIYRVTVTVTWPDQRCTGGSCSYTVRTLSSPSQDDPTFA